VVGGPIQGLQINNIRGTNTCNWPDLESVQGTFDFTTCDSFVNGVAGLEGLVNFAYTASWAAVSGVAVPGVVDFRLRIRKTPTMQRTLTRLDIRQLLSI
jgi:hypothetical protein